MESIIEMLQLQKYRDSTKQNYYGIWRHFNNFFLHLDRKPRLWEDQILLFIAYLIKENRQSLTIKSYISAIKAVLSDIDVTICADRCLINSLTRACWINNDNISIRLPIQKDLLNLSLHTTQVHFSNLGQIYLLKLYMALLSTAYYGLFQIGELTMSKHSVKAKDVHIGMNKKKIMFVLYSSKTHNRSDFPQSIKITSLSNMQKKIENGSNLVKSPSVITYCPFLLLREYLRSRPDYLNNEEQFFVFQDRSPIKPNQFRIILKKMLQSAGVKHCAYSSQSLRAGRATDMIKMGVPVSIIQKIGRWKSNTVYNYLK